MDGGEGLTASLAALAAVAGLLAWLIFRRFATQRHRSHLYWGAGLALVAVTIAQEAAIYAGFRAPTFLQLYLVLVAALVGVLSMGSAELQFSRRWRLAWAGYLGTTCAVLAVVTFVTPVPSALVVDGVVSGVPPLAVIVVSSLVTIPAAVLLIVSSLYGAWRRKRWQLLYVAGGTMVLSASGALYLAAFPLTQYYADFVGVALLFLGFVRLRLAPSPTAGAAPS
jgi:hypothetical protein